MSIRLNNKRPDFSDSIYFCVPAAFTTPGTTIDGLFYIDGKKINAIRHPSLNGAVMFGGGAFNFIEADKINSALLSEIEKKGFSFFQQQLLIKDSVVVQDTLFKKDKNKRRALIQIGDDYAVAESETAVIIKEFQLALLSKGVVNAIYLDMGTWSEGWYRSKDKEKIVIAESKVNTHKQTNWLTFETGNGN